MKPKEEELDEKLFLFETEGFSMWPFLKAGEKLLIKKTTIEDLDVGNIILYRSDNQLVCHRLINKIKDKEEYLLYARGDNSASLPELVAESMFLGKVTGILKNRKIIDLTTTKRVFVNRFIVIIAPLVSAGVRVAKALFFRER